MLFSSPLFLFLFLPTLPGLYFILGPRFRNGVLLPVLSIFNGSFFAGNTSSTGSLWNKNTPM